MNSNPENQSGESLNDSEHLQKVSIEELAAITHEDITKSGAFVLDLLKSPDTTTETELRNAWTKYAELTEAFVDSFENPQLRSKAQTAAIINKALIFQAADYTVRYLEELDSAEVYAANEGFEEVSATLTAEIHSNIESLETTPEVLVLKLKGTIEDSNREYLRDLIEDGADLEDILGSAYGMILEEGGDPDEVLASIGIT